jgi:hypothetical protein
MPLAKIEFKPGYMKDESALQAEGAWIDGDRMRFRRGKPQTIGGWDLVTSQTIDGPARGAHDWSDLSGSPLLACGTATKLYAFVGGSRIDITPYVTQGVLSNPFTTVNASPTVTVVHAQHGLKTGDTITFSPSDAVGGLTISGTYSVTVVSVNSYTITHGSSATSTVSVAAGGTVDFYAPLGAGNVDGTATGYGTSTYGSDVYGASTVADTEPRIWAMDNWGERLLASPRGGALYEYAPANSYPELVANGTFASTASWATGTNWSIASGVATKTAGSATNLSQSVSGLVLSGYVYEVTFTVVRTAGTVKFQVNAGSVLDVGGFPATTSASTAISKSGTYTRQFYAPSSVTDIVFAADAAFAGTIDNVSLKLYSRAYRITTAPTNIDYFFVDPNRIVVALATQEADGDFNPLLVRWSDQDNNRQWVPAADNLAGEFTLASGGRALTGIATRQQNMVWTDSSLYSMQFSGDTNAFSFRLLGTGCGAIGRNACTEHNGIVLWMSQEGFYIFQGAVPQKIDCTIARDVYDHLALNQNDKIFAGINGGFDEVWWFYADSRDGIECSRIAAFNWIEQHWAAHQIPRSCWLSSGIFPYPIGFGTDGVLYYHERGNTAAGNALNPYIISGDFDVADGANLMVIRRIVPDFDDQVGDVAFTLYSKPFPNASELVGGPYTASTTTQMLNMRRQGRQFRLKLASTATNCFYRVGALRLDAMPTGALR